MWKTFWAELKHIFKHKWRPWEWILILFIPFFYGFFYMNAYWNPFGNVDKLRIAVVDLDKTNDSQEFAKSVQKSGKEGLDIGSDVYKVNIEQPDEIYKTEEETKELIKNDKYDAIVIIHEGYQKNRTEIRRNVLTTMASVLIDRFQGKTTDLSKEIEKILAPIKDKGLVTFNNSLKHSYLAGEMTNFGAGLSALSTSSFYPSFNELKDAIAKAATSITVPNDAIRGLLSVITGDHHSDSNIIDDSHSWGKNINTYGFGLAPYFLCIGLWAGALTMTFLIKNERHIPSVSTMRHYFGKTLMWLLTGWIQTIILVTGITLQGVDLGANQWQLYLVGLFISTIFALTVQGIAYSLRYGDLGEFAAVIFLVIQLVSSSGTFPVEVQGSIFRIVNPIIPFTYAINMTREIMYMPDIGIVLENFGILFIFPIIFVTMALIINWWFDKKNKVVEKGKPKYKSFEIHLGDF